MPVVSPIGPAVRVHDLKVWPDPFADLLSGRKTYEVRKADRDFQVGDNLLLREWRHVSSRSGLAALFDDAPDYTGRAIGAQIVHLTHGPVEFGNGVLVPKGVVVLGIEVDVALNFLAPKAGTPIVEATG